MDEVIFVKELDSNEDEDQETFNPIDLIKNPIKSFSNQSWFPFLHPGRNIIMDNKFYTIKVIIIFADSGQTVVVLHEASEDDDD